MSVIPMSDNRIRPPVGHTSSIDVDTIIVGARHRKNFGDLQSLADSVAEIGLLQPIGVTADRTLVFGERRLLAVRDILGHEQIDVRVLDISSIVVGEYAENEMRKDFTPSERVAIAEAVKVEVGQRQGLRTDQLPDHGPEVRGETRNFAACRAGFNSGRHLDRASNVVRLGVPALVEAMDAGKVSITAAAAIAGEAPADQVVIVRM